MSPVVKRIQHKMLAHFYFDSSNEKYPVILLAGGARSGTTWISELINFKNDFRYIFEPFHPRHGVELKGIIGRTYISPETKDEKLLAVAKNVVYGKIRGQWFDKFNRKFFIRGRLIKDVYANLLLKWIKVNFPQIKIILVLRHPCAVATSRRNVEDWDFYTDPKQFLIQEGLMQDYLAPFVHTVTNVKTAFECSVLTWCVENYVPLQQFSKDEIYIALYEDFCSNPKYETLRMFKYLGRSYDANIEPTLKRPSSVTTKNVRSHTEGEQSWLKECSKNEIARAYEIMECFGLDVIYPMDKDHSLENALSLLIGQ